MAQKPNKWHSIDRVSCEIVGAWAYLSAARLTLLILEGKREGERDSGSICWKLLVKVVFSQKGLMRLSYLQTD